MLRTAHNPIECAFGHLKVRWPILTRKMDLNLETIPTVVMACFVLHNFCIFCNFYILVMTDAILFEKRESLDIS